MKRTFVLFEIFIISSFLTEIRANYSTNGTEPASATTLSDFFETRENQTDPSNYSAPAATSTGRILIDRDRFTGPDFRVGEILKKWNWSTPANPEELGTYIQGDIVFGVRHHKRFALNYEDSKWKRAVVPYELSVGYSDEDQKLIRKAMDEYQKSTCIRFIPRDALTNDTQEDADYVSIEDSPGGCFSQVGRQGGKQVLNLQRIYCTIWGTVLHELGHVLGLLHEHMRYDRDKFVVVRWDNIADGFETDFNLMTATISEDFGIGYDYESIMHYSGSTFAKNRSLGTMITKDPSMQSKIGQRVSLSEKDVEKINLLYGCPKKSDKQVLMKAIEKVSTAATEMIDAAAGVATVAYIVWLTIFFLLVV